MLCNASTLNACTAPMICTITALSPGSITVRLRRGAAASLSGLYLFFFDAANVEHLLGQFN